MNNEPLVCFVKGIEVKLYPSGTLAIGQNTNRSENDSPELNAAFDAIESMLMGLGAHDWGLLAHPGIVRAVQVALDAIENHYGDE
jgi:hypothetical protein